MNINDRFKTDNYICVFKLETDKEWKLRCINTVEDITENAGLDYQLIHKKHKDILDAYLKDNNVDIWKDTYRGNIDYFCKVKNFILNYDPDGSYSLRSPEQILLDKPVKMNLNKKIKEEMYKLLAYNNLTEEVKKCEAYDGWSKEDQIAHYLLSNDINPIVELQELEDSIIEDYVTPYEWSKDFNAKKDFNLEELDRVFRLIKETFSNKILVDVLLKIYFKRTHS